MSDDDYRIEKLPKWAQNRIRRLEEDVENLLLERGRVQSGQTDTRVIDHVHGHINLPPRSQIRFELPWEGWEQEALVDVRIEHDHNKRPFLEVRAGRFLRIHPLSANTIHLYAGVPTDEGY